MPDWSRRQFLRGAGVLGLGGAVGALSGRGAGAAAPPRPVPALVGYDLEHYRKTDPGLIHYDQVANLRSPREGPRRLTCGPDGTLWLTAGKFIVGLDNQGTKTAEFAAEEEVQCLEALPDGAVLAGMADHVEIFDKQGKRQAKWSPPAQKVWLTSLAAGKTDVFAADATNRLVWRFDRAGKVTGRIGEKNKAQDQPGFLVPSPYFDLGLGGDGYLWVANPGLHQLLAFTLDGRLEQKWGEPGFAIEKFCGCCNPSYFTRLPDGHFVTSEKGLNRIKIYSADGFFECVVAGPEAFPRYAQSINSAAVPVDVAADAAGRVYVADTLGNQIRLYERKKKA
jgi:hypothetical protein